MAESWANKYRPESISEYIGDSVKEPIVSRFSTGNDEDKPHVILLRGTRGCGKTTMANLIAKEFNCIDKQNNLACGHCEICQDMNNTLIHAETGVETQGATLVDIASERGVGSIDELIREALLEPIYPYKYKVFIFDEFHMATDTAQNRLLKVFEDVPKHLVFILCTTDPEKIKSTILSRCQMNLEVRKPTEEQMVQRLEYICEQEKVKVSREALKAIVKKKDRIPRECILLLEEIAKGFNFVVNIENLKKHFSEVSSEIYCKFFRSADTSLDAILEFMSTLKEKGIEPRDFMKGLIRFTLDSAYIQRGIGLSEYPADYVKQTQSIFKQYNSEEIEIIFEIIEQALKSNLSDSTQAEFVVVNAGIKIGRSISVFRDLKELEFDTKEENQKAYNKYVEALKEERKNSAKDLQSTAIKGVTGLVGLDPNKIKEIKSSNNVAGRIAVVGEGKSSVIPMTLRAGFGATEQEKEGSAGGTLSADELLKMFEEGQ